MNGHFFIKKFFCLQTILATVACLTAWRARADTPDAKKDILLFTDGEKLVGQLQSADSGSLTFKSDMAGVVIIDWKKVQELHTSTDFVVIRKGTKLVWRGKYPDILKGSLTAADQKMQIAPPTPAPPVPVSVADTEAVVPASDFEKAVTERPGIFQDWKGSGSVGISLVEATQTSQTYTSAINLVRALPLENWLQPNNRTIINFTSSYGTISEPKTPTVKTSIFHGSAERDEYFSPSVYALADAGFDHDFSQGLYLQQTYGGGVGWTAIKNPKEELDLKAELTFVNQQFQISSENQKLFGSIFAEAFNRKFKHNLIFNEQLSFNPAWTNLHAYSAVGTASLTAPVFKRIGVSLSLTDAFLNNPSPGFRKNSLQFSTALTYTLP
jgi:hypothetical protein